MTQVKDIIDQMADAYSPEDDEEESLNSFGCPYWMEKDLLNVIDYMTQYKQVTNEEGNLVPVSRFGIFSLLLQKTPVFIFDNPIIEASFGKTAFTDGINIFIDKDFYQALIKAEEEYQEELRVNFNNPMYSKKVPYKYGVIPLLLHEECHILEDDVYRLREYDPLLANIAQDLLHNTSLQIQFPEIVWVDYLREIGYGFKPEDMRYAKMSEEQIAEELYNKKKEEEDISSKLKKGTNSDSEGEGEKSKDSKNENKAKQNSDSLNKQNSKSNDSKKEENKSEDNGKSEKNKDGKESEKDDSLSNDNKQGKSNSNSDKNNKNKESGNNSSSDSKEEKGKGQKGNPSPIHTRTPKEVHEVLKEAGLQAVAEKLGYPSEDKTEAEMEEIYEKMKTDHEDLKERTIQDAITEQSDSKTGSKYPGGPMLTSARQRMKAKTKGKLNWKEFIIKQIWATGMKQKHYEDLPNDLYYVEEIEELLGMRLYEGTPLSIKSDDTILFLIDTSMSMTKKILQEVVNECVSYKRAASFSESAREVVIISADTSLKGLPVVINDSNIDEIVEEGFELNGRGGTNLAKCIMQAIKSDEMKNKKIKSIVYFTDLGDSPPLLKTLDLPKDVSFTYIATGDYRGLINGFRKKVEDYATVIPLIEGQEVDMTLKQRKI